MHFVPARLLLTLFLFIFIAAPLSAQYAPDSGGCFQGTVRDFSHSFANAGHGLATSPKAIFKPHNLIWELPVAAATGILIAEADSHLITHDPPTSAQRHAGTASNVIISSEAGTAGVMYLVGCGTHNPYERHAGVAAAVGLGYALALDLAAKAAFNRQYPDKWNGDGQFWGGGKSFPSGHSASAFGLASALSAAFPNHPRMKWAFYGASASVAILRVVARKHFPSDVVAGSALGFASGRAVGSH